MGGSAWIKAGSSPGTSGAMCWNLFPGPEWPSGGAIVPQNVADLELPEPLMAANALFMAFWGCFEPFRSPLMAMSEGKKIPTYQHVCPLS